MKKASEHILTLLNSLYKYSLAALLIFVPLYPKFPLFNVPFTYVAIRAEDFLIAFIWIVFVAIKLVEKKIKLPPLSYQILVYVAVGLVSCLSALLITKNAQPLLVVLHWFRRLEYMSAFFLVYWGAKSIKDRKFFLELAILPSVGVFLYGIAQIYFQAPVISTMDSEASKGIALILRSGVTLSSTFSGHYDLAVYLTMILTFLAALGVSTTSWIKRLPLFIGFGALVWLLMQAGLRTSLAGIGLSILMIAFVTRKYLVSGMFMLMILIGVATSPQLISRFESIFGVVIQTITDIAPQPVLAVEAPVPTPTSTPIPEVPRDIQADRSTSIRFDVEWPRAVRAFSKSPLLGTGYSSLTLATDNDYLRSIGEVGILGFLAFMSIIIALFKALIDRLKDPNTIHRVIVISALGILISFLTTGMFLDVFESSKIATLFWAYMGLAISTKS